MNRSLVRNMAAIIRTRFVGKSSPRIPNSPSASPRQRGRNRCCRIAPVIDISPEHTFSAAAATSPPFRTQASQEQCRGPPPPQPSDRPPENPAGPKPPENGPAEPVSDALSSDPCVRHSPFQMKTEPEGDGTRSRARRAGFRGGFLIRITPKRDSDACFWYNTPGGSGACRLLTAPAISPGADRGGALPFACGRRAAPPRENNRR